MFEIVYSCAIVSNLKAILSVFLGSFGNVASSFFFYFFVGRWFGKRPSWWLMGLFFVFFKSFSTSRCSSHKCVNSQRSSSSSVIRVSSWNHPRETTSPYPAMIVKIQTLRQTQCMLVFITDLVTMYSLKRLDTLVVRISVIYMPSNLLL